MFYANRIRQSCYRSNLFAVVSAPGNELQQKVFPLYQVYDTKDSAINYAYRYPLTKVNGNE